MPDSDSNRPLILGEFRRTLDDRYRLSVPSELAEPLTDGNQDCVLVKERPGSLSLWSTANWKQRMEGAVNIVETKWKAGRLDNRLHDVQSLGRLLSTRHKEVQLAGRGRLVIPEGFREFLGIESGGDVLLIGAAVCVEIWRVSEWIKYLDQQMPEFGGLLDELSA